MSADFFDSNLFVYMFDPTDIRKRDLARELVSLAVAERSASISHQVVQETLNVVTSKMASRLTREDTRRLLEEVLVPLWDIAPTAATYERALDVSARYGFVFYDALIVASAIEGGCTRLYSEDFQHGQRIGSLVIENPFLG
jgi:predicted nucleic acid-binding protein